MSNKTILSKNLITARKNKGWSQQGAAEAIREAGAENFTRSYLAKLESDRIKSANMDFVQFIVKAYDIDDWDLFVKDENYFEKQIPAEELKKRFDSLQTPTRRAVRILLGL